MNSRRKPKYILGMFPYPSGAGLHVGHVRIYTACDVMARFYRMKGYEVLFPMGWDAFGLPAENAAIKEKKNPMDMVPQNEANFKRQMQMMGLSYDWSHEFSTTNPEYYKWTQWLFQKLYSIKNSKGERLIYRQEVPINWCPFCKTGLANEEVLGNGTHERCGKPVTKKMLPQWVMRITDYADRLLEDLEGLDWPAGILEMQKNWIGKKEGVTIKFRFVSPPLSDFAILARPDGRAVDATQKTTAKQEIDCFTTRVDTIFGVSFVVVAPEMVKEWMDNGWQGSKEVEDYVTRSLQKTEEQRQVGEKQKTGIDTGLAVINPVNGEEVPVWVADYVLANFGTGAVMGVPAHDERDKEFAEKFGLPIKQVVVGGKLVESGEFDGLTSEEAMEVIPKKYTMVMRKEKQYHLRDWVFSRQRYWGEPFPLVYCDKCGDENGVVLVPEEQLPVKLPYLQSYEPTDTGESPLSKVGEWVETTCPKCGGKARRETDTMPNWAGSCWYFLAYPWWGGEMNGGMENVWKEKQTVANQWLPVEWYLGGAEHAVLHLLYARFWTKAFYDLDLVGFKEPFLRLRSVGMVLAEDGRKMSKSFGNVINPDDMVAEFGVDAVRLYEMFMGPWEAAIAWDTRSLVGCKRFLDRIRNLATKASVAETNLELKIKLHQTIKKIEADIPEQKFNTAIAALMELVNSWEKAGGMVEKEKQLFLTILAPFAPFLAEELFGAVHDQAWPEYDPGLLVSRGVKLMVQVNGKMRAVIVDSESQIMNQQLAEEMVTANEGVKKWIEGKEVVKVVFVPDKGNGQALINWVVK